MKRYEYKTIDLKLKGMGIFGPKKAQDFESTLNEEGANGWKYVDTVLQTGLYGEASSLRLVFERSLD